METVFRAIAFAGVATLAACGTGATETHAASFVDTTDTAPGAVSGDGNAAKINEALASADGLAIVSGDIHLRLRSAGCEPFVEGLLACEDDVRLDVAMPRAQLQQTLHPAAVMLKAGSLVYRGPLHADDRPDAHSFIISDVNADGREDLILWSGRDGAYGGPSFQVYLFDEGDGQLHLSEAFSELTVGYVGIFGVDGRAITTDAKSGCCLHVQETYVVEASVPELVERVTTEEEADGTAKVTTERLLDGKLQIVDDE
ncbi:XAC2610-related protein [Luteimonas terricola]|uniref:VCBS repeat-containing protein n=1 Tax=Luteimonas terricola TaxID=645597 RepID=A0ABQ2E623_9GAMM|nr:hypothetical protein [Luteimonas terricola]GGJ97338.1 hypothetical protein GCM10011394_02800 [Luteimonas terricola]